ERGPTQRDVKYEGRSDYAYENTGKATYCQPTFRPRCIEFAEIICFGTVFYAFRDVQIVPVTVLPRPRTGRALRYQAVNDMRGCNIAGNLMQSKGLPTLAPCYRASPVGIFLTNVPANANILVFKGVRSAWRGMRLTG